MKVSEKFASNYLKAEDLQGRKVHVVIASVGFEQINGEDHLATYFRGKQKSLILNKTNASYLASAISDETDNWAGQEIVLYPAKVNFQGRMVDAIRVEMPASGSAQQRRQEPVGNAHAQASQSAQAATSKQPLGFDSSGSAELDDEIPF